MRRIADGVWKLGGVPPNAINVYLVGDVLIDGATRFAGRRILRQLRGRAVVAHALTHAHPGHQGASAEVCRTLGIPLWCGAGDADAMEQGTIAASRPPVLINRIVDRVWSGPRYPVARRLRAGDEVAGFAVLEVPGHSPGHVAYWRASDRVLILGDVLTNLDTATGIPGLEEPKAYLTADPTLNRASARRLSELEPELVCFGHGAPLRNPWKFQAFVRRLPAT